MIPTHFIIHTGYTNSIPLYTLITPTTFHYTHWLHQQHSIIHTGYTNNIPLCTLVTPTTFHYTHCLYQLHSSTILILCIYLADLIKYYINQQHFIIRTDYTNYISLYTLLRHIMLTSFHYTPSLYLLYFIIHDDFTNYYSSSPK